MRYIVRMPVRGEMIRVNRGKYYHYGICTGANEVIHFATVNGDGFDSSDNASVLKTDIPGFSKGAFIECAEFRFHERRTTYTRKQTAARAEKALGETGYDVLNNNCLHFANRCLYGNSAGTPERKRPFFRCFEK